MKKGLLKIAALTVLVAGLAACNGGSMGPDGWQAAAGSTTQWTKTAGGAAQQYSLDEKTFGGSLQDLASQQAINVVLQNKGAKFKRSDIFDPCPGRAALATYESPSVTIQQGISVIGGNSVIVTYTRPKGSTADPAVAAAMEKALCQT